VLFLGTVPELIPFDDLIQLPVMQLKLFDHSFYRLIGGSDIQKIAKDIVDDLHPPSGPERKSPFALVSMSRGGKTRALLELTRALRERGIPTIYITFNDETPFAPDEEDLVMALIRRMTFALRSGSECCIRCYTRSGLNTFSKLQSTTHTTRNYPCYHQFFQTTIYNLPPLM